MNHDARHREIAALLARGAIRAIRQPTVANVVDLRMPAEQEHSSQRQNRVNSDSAALQNQDANGGDQ